MGKRRAVRSIDNDYFDEPDYDKYSDEELDELYQYGEIRSARPLAALTRKKAGPVRTGRGSRLLNEGLEDGLDLDLDGALEDDWIDDDDTDDFFDD